MHVSSGPPSTPQDYVARQMQLEQAIQIRTMNLSILLERARNQMKVKMSGSALPTDEK